MEFIITHKHPWQGPSPEGDGSRVRGTEIVVSRCVLTGLTDDGQMSYRTLRIIDVENPMPGGAYDGDKWKAQVHAERGSTGGMTTRYFGELLQSGGARLCLDAATVVMRDGGFEFTDDEMHRYFDMVRNRTHWKNPIRRCAILPTVRDVYGMHAAVVYIAGCVPEVECINAQTHKYRVSAIGYFMAVGA